MRDSFTHCGSYIFNFSSSGFFTLINKKGEPLYESSLPYFEKAVGHLLWMALWVLLIFLTHPRLDRFFMALIVFHLFLFGCRLTTLLINGGIKPLVFPPLWIKVTRDLQKGEGFDLLKKHHLHQHPGLLANLALITHARGDSLTAQDLATQALALVPDHPHLTKISLFVKMKIP